MKIGDRVKKSGGSFQHTGTLVSVFKTTGGEERVVLEFDAPVAGMLHVYRPDQLAPLTASPDVDANVVQRYLDAQSCYEQATRNNWGPSKVLRYQDPIVVELRNAHAALIQALGSKGPALKLPIPQPEPHGIGVK